jgi:hypothetical protein
VAAGVLAVVAVAAAPSSSSVAPTPRRCRPRLPPRPHLAAPAAPTRPSGRATLPTATNLSIGRNPFKVPGLYIPPPPEVPSTAAPAPVATGTAPAPVGTGTAPAPVGTGTCAGSRPAPRRSRGHCAGSRWHGRSAAPEKHKLILLRVFGEGPDRSAAFSIHGTEQIAKVGSIFGPDRGDPAARAHRGAAGQLDGDAAGRATATPFDVITGEPAYVR